MSTDPNDEAFPIPMDCSGLRVHGLTKREFIAAMAMQGIAAYPGDVDGRDNVTGAVAARVAVSWADALIDRLNETEKSR